MNRSHQDLSQFNLLSHFLSNTSGSLTQLNQDQSQLPFGNQTHINQHSSTLLNIDDNNETREILVTKNNLDTEENFLALHSLTESELLLTRNNNQNQANLAGKFPNQAPYRRPQTICEMPGVPLDAMAFNTELTHSQALTLEDTAALNAFAHVDMDKINRERNDKLQAILNSNIDSRKQEFKQAELMHQRQ